MFTFHRFITFSLFHFRVFGLGGNILGGEEREKFIFNIHLHSLQRSVERLGVIK